MVSRRDMVNTSDFAKIECGITVPKKYKSYSNRGMIPVPIDDMTCIHL